MARVRRAGEPPMPPLRGPTETPLAFLLRARRFRVTAGGDRVAANLVASAGQLSPEAPAWVGDGVPPVEAPSLSLGAAIGTLGPRSYGFLNNSQPGLGAIVALDVPPIAALPRTGRLGIIVPGREALPDLLPLLCARDLPISWLISIGDGDPSEVVSFLSEDPATDAIAIALGEGAKAVGLRAVTGAKPTVFLGGDPIARAVARRAGAYVVDRIGEWLALGALLGAGVTLDVPVEIWVQGGGLEWIRREAARYAVDAPIVHLDERAPDSLEQALRGITPPRLIVLAGAAISVPVRSVDTEALRVVVADTRQPEQVSRLLSALGAELRRRAGTVAAEARPITTGLPVAVDSALAARVRAESEGALGDHDAKRLLKAWGLKVTRQGPTGTPTGAAKLARLIDLPVVLARGDDERIADSAPEVRRIAALLLEAESDEPRSVMVREQVPEAPRARVKIAAERGVGLTMRVGEALALLPLDAGEALRLAQQSGARRAADQRVVADVLVLLGAAALAETALFDVELFCGPEPIVVRATATLRRPGAV